MSWLFSLMTFLRSWELECLLRNSNLYKPSGRSIKTQMVRLIRESFLTRLGKWCRNLKFHNNPKWWTHPTINHLNNLTINPINHTTNHTHLHHITTHINQFIITLMACTILIHHRLHNTILILTVLITTHHQTSNHTILIIVSSNLMEDIMEVIWVEVWIVVLVIGGEGCSDFPYCGKKHDKKFKTLLSKKSYWYFYPYLFLFFNFFM